MPGIGPKWLGGTRVHSLVLPTQAIPFPQSRELLELAEAILDFFLDSFSFSPALTISFSSFLQSEQYLLKYIYIFNENKE